MSIYDDLIRFKLGLLERVKRELPKLHPVAQKAADVDVTFIEIQMAGYYERLDLWYQRVWKLQGLRTEHHHTFVYPAEIFPVRVRTSSHGNAAASGKIGAFVGTYALTALLPRIGLASTSALVGAVAAVGAVVTITMLPEPKGQSLEEITEGNAAPTDERPRACVGP